MKQAIKLSNEEGLIKELEIYFEPLAAQKIFLRKAAFRFDPDFIKIWPIIKKGNRGIEIPDTDPKIQGAFELIGKEDNVNFHVFNFNIKGKEKIEQIKEKINYAFSFKEAEKVVIFLNISHKSSFEMDDGEAIRNMIKLKKENSPIVAIWLEENIVKQDVIYLQVMTINGSFF